MTHTAVITLTLLILLAPLVSSLLVLVSPGRLLKQTLFLSWVILALSSIASLVVWFSLGDGMQGASVSWFKINGQQIQAGVEIDNLSSMMLFVVSFISALVHAYSTRYMDDDKFLRRYFVVLGFFTFSMLGIVIADSLLLLFFFWEGVGFSSYLLIGHYNDLPAAGSASKKAFMMNRLGDLAFLVGLMLVWNHTGSFAFSDLLQANTGTWATAASLCMLGGVVAKSAQFPLLTWLPDAMAGPTPVSALIHAATMVAAGVFLLAKVLFLFTPLALTAVLVTGFVTALIGGFSALVQFDIKRVLAYSTVSQLGFMMIGMGTGAGESAMLHLFTHAFFKAGLFLAAGSLIHAAKHAVENQHLSLDVQDIRHLSGLRTALPTTFYTFIICGASLAGVPFFSGFQSKESILSALVEWAATRGITGYALVGLAFFISLLTIVYMIRLLWYLYWKQDADLDALAGVHDVPTAMKVPMVVLSFGSLWWVVSVNPFSYDGWIVMSDSAHPVLTVVSAAWVILGTLMAARVVMRRKIGFPNRVASFLRDGFHLDATYKKIVVEPMMTTSRLTHQTDRKILDGLVHFVAYAQITFAFVMGWVDRHIIDGSVAGATYLVRLLGRLSKSFQSGNIQYYIVYAVLGLVVLIYVFLS